MYDGVPRFGVDGGGEVRPVATGVDPHVVAAGGESRRQVGDVGVLSAGVRAAEIGQRTGVLRDHRYPHLVSSASGVGWGGTSRDRHQPRSQWPTARGGIRALVASMVVTSSAVRGPGAIRVRANSAVPATQAAPARTE